MSLPQIVNEVQKVLRQNSPAILTAVGVSGTLGTAYLAGRASYLAAKRIGEGPPTENMTKREIVEQIWDLYIPAAVSGVVTVASILGANHISSKRTAAAYTAVAVVEKGFTAYRDKVIEQIGTRKEQTIRDEIVQDHIKANPPGAIVVGSGSVLCCEMFTGRYFNCDMETLRKAENTINAKLIGEMYVTMNEFYYMIGLPQTSYSGTIGWESNKMMALEFSTVMSEDGRPCLAFEYNYTKPL